MSRTSKLRLILADDHPVLREGLSLILGLLPDMAVADQASWSSKSSTADHFAGDQSAALSLCSVAYITLRDIQLFSLRNLSEPTNLLHTSILVSQPSPHPLSPIVTV